MIETVGRITQEDHSRLLLVESRKAALETNPAAYSSAESEEIVRAYFVLVGELLDRYNVDEGRGWVFSQYTGLIFYED